jgi:hypothetical protein
MIKIKNEKPSMLFILTGLGPYSWWKLPFFKGHTFCASLPSIISFRITRALAFVFHFSRGSCKCKLHSCKWVRFFDLAIGLCERGRKVTTKKRK